MFSETFAVKFLTLWTVEFAGYLVEGHEEEGEQVVGVEAKLAGSSRAV